MIKTLKYRLYPTKRQIESLNIQLTGHRHLYNKALEQRINIYEKTGKGITYREQAGVLLDELSNFDPYLNQCNNNAAQQTLRRLDQAYQRFFKANKSGNRGGHPRFKAHDRFNTFKYGAFGNGCKIKDNRLYLQRIGLIKVKWQQPIDGAIKTLSITRRNEKWYACFCIDFTAVRLPPAGAAEHRLKKAQRLLSRKEKGSNRRKKARKLVARQHEKIANRRLDFIHKTTHALVQNYNGFAVESLNIKGMVKNHKLAKSISDAGWGMFASILKYKAENAGRWYEEVSPGGTSQNCSACGKAVPKTLAERIHCCPYCGLSIDRDVNAAINILARTEPSRRGGAVMPLVETRSL